LPSETYLIVSESASLGQRLYVDQRRKMLDEMGYDARTRAIPGREISMTFDVVAKSVLARDVVGRVMKEIRPSIVEFYCPATYLSLPGRLLSKYFTILSFDAPAYVNFTGTGSSVLRRLEARRLRGCDRVISLTRYGARIATEEYGVDEGAVHRIPYAGTLKPRRPGEGFALSYCAETKPLAKGLGLLAQAWSLLNREIPLLITGIAPEPAERCLRATGIPKPTTMKFLGTIPRRDYEALLSSCDLYVSASLWEEFGQSLVDALSWSKPLAVTPALGPTEIAGTIDRSMVATSFSPQDLARTITRAGGMAQGPSFHKSVKKRFRPFEWKSVRGDLRRLLKGPGA